MNQMLRIVAIHYVVVIHALHQKATNHLYLVPNWPNSDEKVHAQLQVELQ
jgi:peptidoglycan/LPS O-acetylase OafA/YrhL